MKSAKPLFITGFVQNYEWGRIGAASVIPELCRVEAEDKPYAELWFGAHKNGPALLVGKETNLAVEIKADPQTYLGSVLSRLPFLLKVLTVRRPLSIQLHPNSVQAPELHRKNPQLYPDQFAKPEIAYAITPLSMLVGFRPSSELDSVLLETPELIYFSKEKRTAPAIFESLLLSSAEEIAQQSRKLEERLKKKPLLNEREKFAAKLFSDYPQGDVGLFCFFLMNLITLQPGEVIYTGAGVPHAYLEGDLVECMVNSDNVVRAGLTPKTKDVQTLLAILDRSEGEALLLEGEPIARGRMKFSPPISEFSLEVFLSGEHEIPASHGPEILFCLEGTGSYSSQGELLQIKKGEAVFLPGVIDESAKLSAKGKIFRAFVAGL